MKFCQPLLLAHNKTPTAPPESVVGSPKSTKASDESQFVSDLIFLESDDEFEHDDDEFEDGFSEESDEGVSAGGGGLYPSLLDSSISPFDASENQLNNRNDDTSGIRAISHNEIRSSNGAGTLPDILNFTTPFSCNNDGNSSLDSTSRDREDNDLILVNFLSVGACSKPPAIPPKPRPKPSTKPIIPYRKPNTSDSNAEEYIKSKNSSDDLIELDDHVYEEVERCRSAPLIPPRPSKPPVLMKNSPQNSSHLVAGSFTQSSTSNSTLKCLDRPPLPSREILSTVASETLPSTPTQTSNETRSQEEEEEAKTFCVCVYDFEGTDDSHLSLRSGQKLQLVERSTDDWWWGELSAGCEGYFPSQYVVVLTHNEQRVLRLLYDFQSTNHVEISVRQGDVVLFVEDRDDWVKIATKDEEGLVPTSYVEFL